MNLYVPTTGSSEIKEALVVGGFSEDHDFLWGLTNELSSGPFAKFENTFSWTLTEVDQNLDKFLDVSENCAVFGHSLGALYMIRAAMAFSLDGAEKTNLLQTFVGAVKVGTNSSVGKESDNVLPTGLMNGALEIARHPVVNSKFPFLVGKTKGSLQTLVDGGIEMYPEGRFYLPARKSEFKFGGDMRVKLARKNGIVSEYLGDDHSYAMLHPRAATLAISQLIERNS